MAQREVSDASLYTTRVIAAAPFRASINGNHQLGEREKMCWERSEPYSAIEEAETTRTARIVQTRNSIGPATTASRAERTA